MTAVQKLLQKPPKSEGCFNVCQSNGLDLAKMLVEGGKLSDGSEVAGNLAILSEAAKELITAGKARIGKVIENLAQISGGDPKSGDLWQQGIRNDCSMAAIVKRAKQTLFVSNGRRIDELSESLKEVVV